MPPKKPVQKQRSQHSLTSETASRQYVLLVQDGADIFGTCSVETFPHEAPKACDVFAQFCVPGSGVTEKGKGKQSVARTISFKRLSDIGVQFGENTTASAKLFPTSEFEAEVGVIAPGVGTLFLCRSGGHYDGGNFFVCMTTDPEQQKHLAARYVAFGRIASGLDVIKSLCAKLLQFAGTDGAVDSATCPFQIADCISTM